ncbi:MAG: phosphoribosylamine--glycine ligase [Bacteroidota bacterium]
MNILILGGGGREHAFAWKMKQSPRCDHLYVAPGNAGTATIATNLSIDPMDFDKVYKKIKKHDIHMVVVGPEAPLVAGISDYLNEKLPEVLVIGPSKVASQLEGSKAFAKQFMADNGIPTASYIEVTKETLDTGIDHIDNHKGPYVLKADGLAAGKGVLIKEKKKEAKKQLRQMLDGKFGSASQTVVIEEFLDGIEFSVFILTDGQYYTLLPVAKDYKRIGEGDVGLNTGGMGAVSPVPFVDAEMMHKVRERIILPTLSGLEKRHIPYVGFIFFGLINVGGDPYVIEYNCRMGDPETEVVLPRIQNDLVDVLESVFEQDLYEIRLEKDPRVAATVVMVSGGYPEAYEKGKKITIGDVGSSIVFHSGTAIEDDKVVTSGGRVLAVTSLGETTGQAVCTSLEAIDNIKFKRSYHRTDIGSDV